MPGKKVQHLGGSILVEIREDNMSKEKSIKMRYLAASKIVDFCYYTVPLLKKQLDKIVLQKDSFDNKEFIKPLGDKCFNLVYNDNNERILF